MNCGDIMNMDLSFSGYLKGKSRTKKSPETRKAWSEKDDEFLMGNYAEMTASKISKVLGFSRVTVCKNIMKLGLSKRVFWKSSWDKELIEIHGSTTEKELAKHFGVTYQTLLNHEKRLGLK